MNSWWPGESPGAGLLQLLRRIQHRAAESGLLVWCGAPDVVDDEHLDWILAGDDPEAELRPREFDREACFESYGSNTTLALMVCVITVELPWLVPLAVKVIG
jgi:hypothetical protein